MGWPANQSDAKLLRAVYKYEYTCAYFRACASVQAYILVDDRY